jgi:O-6-methylguanine DNA methyltransferase
LACRYGSCRLGGLVRCLPTQRIFLAWSARRPRERGTRTIRPPQTDILLTPLGSILVDDMVTASLVFETPVGPLLAVACSGKLIQLSFRHRSDPSDGSNDGVDAGDAELLEAVEGQIAEYFARTRTQFDLPLNLQGPAFHRRVWAALCEIPYGQTVSYGQLAAELGDPGLARAVGTANGANPIAIVVPCHRVIGADGSLVGYGGGLDRKRILLDLESHNVQLAL